MIVAGILNLQIRNTIPLRVGHVFFCKDEIFVTHTEELYTHKKKKIEISPKKLNPSENQSHWRRSEREVF